MIPDLEENGLYLEIWIPPLRKMGVTLCFESHLGEKWALPWDMNPNFEKNGRYLIYALNPTLEKSGRSLEIWIPPKRKIGVTFRYDSHPGGKWALPWDMNPTFEENGRYLVIWIPFWRKVGVPLRYESHLRGKWALLCDMNPTFEESGRHFEI